MKRILIFILGAVLFCQPCMARDFIVEFISENYRETRQSFSYSPIIYHSIQVKTDAGTKLLILTGENTHYRTWLRQFIAQGKQFIVDLPDEQDDLFISSSAFEVDVGNVHPVNLSRFNKSPKNSNQSSGLTDTP